MKARFELSEDEIKAAVCEYVEKHRGMKIKSVRFDVSQPLDYFDQPSGSPKITATAEEETGE